MIIAMQPSESFRKKFAVEGGLKEDTLHMTLFFLGKSEDVTFDQLTKAMEVLLNTVERFGPIKCTATQVDRFENVRKMTDAEGNMVDAVEPTDVVLLKIESDELKRLRQYMADALDRIGCEYSKIHKEFKPHISLKYVPHGSEVDLGYELPAEFEITHLEFWGETGKYSKVLKGR